MVENERAFALGVGRIITRPGVMIPLDDTNSKVAFGGDGDSTTVLYTTTNESFEGEVVAKRAEVRVALRREDPVHYMEELAAAALASAAGTESPFSIIAVDAGTALFHDNLFSHPSDGSTSDYQFPAAAWRRVCSPALEAVRTGHTVIQVASLLEKMANAGTEYDTADRLRRQMVASVFSFLAALAVKVMHETAGRMSYIPNGHCVIVAMPSDAELTGVLREVKLVINDPTGSGWRILDERFHLGSDAPVTRTLETLVEFSAKCVADTITKTRSLVLAPLHGRHPSSPGMRVKARVSTSDNSNCEGDGYAIAISEDGRNHFQVPLTDFRVDFKVGHGRIMEAVVGPRVVGQEDLTAPSLLKWFGLHFGGHGLGRTAEHDGFPKGTSRDLLVWREVPVVPAIKPRKWRICKIYDSAPAETVNSWHEKIVGLQRFDMATESQRQAGSSNLFDRVAASVSLVVGRMFGGLQGAVPPPVYTDRYEPPGSTNKDLETAALLLTDIYSFRDNGNRPVVSVGLKEDEDGTRNYTFWVMGNAPSADTLRAVRLVKRAGQSEGASSGVQCPWYRVSPSAVGTDDPRCTAKRWWPKGGVGLGQYTPRCIYHDRDSHVHLYSDYEGPYERVRYKPATSELFMGTGKGATAANAWDTLERPLLLASLASERELRVNKTIIASPHQGHKVPNTGEGEQDIIIVKILLPLEMQEGTERAEGVSISKDMCSGETQAKCDSSFLPCPSEKAVLDYVLNNPPPCTKPSSHGEYQNIFLLLFY